MPQKQLHFWIDYGDPKTLAADFKKCRLIQDQQWIKEEKQKFERRDYAVNHKPKQVFPRAKRGNSKK